MTLVERDAGKSRSRASWALPALALVTVAAWAGAVVPAGSPGTDGWWQSVLTVGAAALTMVLAVWLPVVVTRRWVAAPWRPATASVLAVLVLGAGAWLAVLSLASLAVSGGDAGPTP